jgi:beta-fructofuranosidase
VTGFRDPYVFTSPKLSSVLSSSNTSNATGSHFVTISGGVRSGATDYLGSRLYLYRQTSNDSVLDWTYLGPMLSTGPNASFSDWSGNFGQNFETAWVTRLTTTGRADDDGSDPDAVDVVGLGTELGRAGCE